MIELIYTSSKEGLVPGRSGFTSVAWTEGFPANLVQPVENFSSYKGIFPPHSPDAAKNPVTYSYRLFRFGGSDLQIVSRISAAGVDYTGRSNKLAHHLIFLQKENFSLYPSGAVSVLREQSNFITEWGERPPMLLPVKTELKYNRLNTDSGLSLWEKYTSDRRWAQVIAKRFTDNPQQSIYLVFNPDISSQDVLDLIAEAAAWIPPEYLNQFTFSTYFTGTPNDSGCFLRAVLPDYKGLDTVRRFHPEDIFPLFEQRSVPSELLRAVSLPSVPEPCSDIQVLTLEDAVDEPAMPAETCIIQQEPYIIPQNAAFPVQENGEAYRETAAEKKTDHGVKKIFYILALLIVAGLIASAFVFVFLIRNSTSVPPVKEPAETGTENPFTDISEIPKKDMPVTVSFDTAAEPADEPVPEKPEVPEEQKKQSPPPVQRPVTKKEEKPAVKAVQNTEPVKKQPAPAVSAKPKVPEKFSSADSFAMLKIWRNQMTGQNGQNEFIIPLPGCLRTAESVSAVCSAIGTCDIKSDAIRRDFSSAPGREFHIYSVQSEQNEYGNVTYRRNTSGEKMIFTLQFSENNAVNLRIRYPGSDDCAPRLENVTELEFQLAGGQVLTWHPVLKDDCLSAMKKGRLTLPRNQTNWNLNWQKSEDEKLFDSEIDIILGKDTLLDKNRQLLELVRKITDFEEHRKIRKEEETKLKLLEKQAPSYDKGLSRKLDDLTRNWEKAIEEKKKPNTQAKNICKLATDFSKMNPELRKKYLELLHEVEKFVDKMPFPMGKKLSLDKLEDEDRKLAEKEEKWEEDVEKQKEAIEKAVKGYKAGESAMFTVWNRYFPKSEQVLKKACQTAAEKTDSVLLNPELRAEVQNILNESYKIRIKKK